MADNESTYDIKIKTDADLKALQAAKAEFAEQAKVIKEAGGESQVLEKNLETLDARIGQRKLALYTQDLKENIAALKGAKQDASELEKALAQTQNATGGGDKWENLGARIGTFGMSVAPAVTAVVGLAAKISLAGDETRKLERAGVEMADHFASAISLSPGAALDGMTVKLREISKEVTDIQDKGWAARKVNFVSELLGNGGDDAKLRQAFRDANKLTELRRDAAKEEHERAQDQIDIQGERLEGHTEEAAAQERFIAFEQKRREIEARFKTTPGEKSFDGEKKNREKAQALEDLEEIYNRQEALLAKVNAKTDAAAVRKGEEAARVQALITAHQEALAEQLARRYEFESKIAALQTSQLGVEAKRIAILAEVDRYLSHEQQIAEASEARDKLHVEMAKDEADAAEARLNDETAESQIALINKKLAHDKAEIIKSNTPEIAAQLIAEKERTAEAKRQSAIKKEGEKNDRDAERDADKADREAEKQAKVDAEFKKQIDDGESLIAIAKARAAGEDEIATQLSIQKTMLDKIAGIIKSDMTAAQKEVLSGLAKEEAALSRIAAARAQFNKAFDAKKAEKNKPAAQKAKEREARIVGDRQEREAVTEKLNEEERNRQKNGERALTNDEKDARREEIQAERGVETRKSREEKKRRARDKDSGSSSKGADFGDDAPSPTPSLTPGFDPKFPSLSPSADVKPGAGGGNAMQPLNAAADSMTSDVKAAAAALQGGASDIAEALKGLDFSAVLSAIADVKSQLDEVRSNA